MQDAERDLRCYVVARQLQISPTLRQVMQRNMLSYPLFYSCLDPRARQLTVQVLLCLQRWLGQGHRETAEEDPSSPTATALALSRARDICGLSRHILSFLAMPALATVKPTRSLLVEEYHQLVEEQEQARAAAAAAAAAAVAGADAAGTPRKEAPVAGTLVEGEASLSTPLRQTHESASTPLAAPGTSALNVTPNRPTTDIAAEMSASRPSGVQPRTSTGSAVAASQQLGQSLADALRIRKPLFYCRPPLEEALTGDAEKGGPVHRPVRSATQILFVRMLHHSTLYEETLNPYFGRYGQTGVEVVRRIPLTEAERFVPQAVLLALAEAFQRTPQELYLQDFLIFTDSADNARRAVDGANYKELLFAALHDPSLNTHALGDVDLIVMRCGSLVLKKQSYGPPWGSALDTAEDEEADAETDKAAEKDTRRRHRKRRHRHSRLTFDDALREGPAVSSSGSSRGSSGSRASSQSSHLDGDTSSSLDEGEHEAGEGGGRDFVPDVLVDGFPYWTSEDHLKLLFKDYGNVLSIQVSLHDVSGAFTGSVLVRMETADEAIHLCEEIHGRNYKGHKLIAGVLNDKLELVSLVNGHEVRQAGVADPDFLATRNERLWT